MEIGIVWKLLLHVVAPLIVSDLRAGRAKSALAGFGDTVDLVWMIWASKSGIAQTFRFTAIGDFPNVICHKIRDEEFEGRPEVTPMILKDLCEGKAFLGNGFHNGNACYQTFLVLPNVSPQGTHNFAPKGRHVLSALLGNQ